MKVKDIGGLVYSVIGAMSVGLLTILSVVREAKAADCCGGGAGVHCPAQTISYDIEVLPCEWFEWQGELIKEYSDGTEVKTQMGAWVEPLPQQPTPSEEAYLKKVSLWAKHLDVPPDIEEPNPNPKEPICRITAPGCPEDKYDWGVGGASIDFDPPPPCEEADGDCADGFGATCAEVGSLRIHFNVGSPVGGGSKTEADYVRVIRSQFTEELYSPSSLVHYPRTGVTETRGQNGSLVEVGSADGRVEFSPIAPKGYEAKFFRVGEAVPFVIWRIDDPGSTQTVSKLRVSEIRNGATISAKIFSFDDTTGSWSLNRVGDDFITTTHSHEDPVTHYTVTTRDVHKGSVLVRRTVTVVDGSLIKEVREGAGTDEIASHFDQNGTKIRAI